MLSFLSVYDVEMPRLGPFPLFYGVLISSSLLFPALLISPKWPITPPLISPNAWLASVLLPQLFSSSSNYA